MSITLDLSDEFLEQLKRLSETTGQTIEQIIRQGLQAELKRPAITRPHADADGSDRLLYYAGCMDSGAPDSGDNAQIDRDLLDAYSNRGEAA